MNSVKNTLDLSLPISVNAYEIDAMFRKINAMSNADGTDFEEDNDIFLIHATTNIISDDYDVVIMPITTALSSKTGVESFIFNVKFTPTRIIERNLLMLHPSLVNDTDVVKMTARTKNVDFFLTEQTKGTYYEGRDFKISPRCGTTTDPILTDDNYKIEAIQYEFTAPTEDFDIRTILNNTTKLILFSYNGIRYAGYIDDFANNPYSQESKTIKLIKAHLTIEEINTLWQ